MTTTADAAFAAAATDALTNQGSQGMSQAAGGLLVGVTPAQVPASNVLHVPAAQPAAPGQPAGQFFTPDDLARARQQEKDKIYPELEKARAELAALRKAQDDRESQEAAALKAAEDEARKKVESETDLRTLWEQKQAEFDARIAEETTKREQAFALLEREREFQALEQYRQQAIAAAEDDIVPELLDLVGGSTAEEINASIAGLKERSSRILESMQSAVQAQRSQQQGTRITVPANGPLDTTSSQQPVSVGDIANMSMDEYAKNRSRLLGQVSRGGQGLFG